MEHSKVKRDRGWYSAKLTMLIMVGAGIGMLMDKGCVLSCTHKKQSYLPIERTIEFTPICCTNQSQLERTAENYN